MEEDISVIELISNRVEKSRKNWSMVKMIYSISKICLISVVFSLLFSVVMSNSTDYKVLSICIAFILLIEFMRSIHW